MPLYQWSPTTEALFQINLRVRVFRWHAICMKYENMLDTVVRMSIFMHSTEQLFRSLAVYCQRDYAVMNFPPSVVVGIESSCNRMELVHSNSTGTGSFTVLNTELENLLVVRYVAYIHQSSFTNIIVHTVAESINVYSSNKHLQFHSKKQ